MNGNYTFDDGITVNASDIQRANEKHDKVVSCKPKHNKIDAEKYTLSQAAKQAGWKSGVMNY